MRSLVPVLVVCVVGCSGPASEPPPLATAAPAPPPPAPEPASAPSIAPAASEAPPTPGAVGVGSLGDPGPGAPCGTDADCVLITNPCGVVMAASRSNAAERQAHYSELARSVDCSAHLATPPVVPACSAGTCTTQPAEYAEGLACRHDRDCYAVSLPCRWVLASHTAPMPTDLADALTRAHEGPAPPCVTPAMPEARCAFGFCAREGDLLPR